MSYTKDEVDKMINEVRALCPMVPPQAITKADLGDMLSGLRTELIERVDGKANISDIAALSSGLQGLMSVGMTACEKNLGKSVADLTKQLAAVAEASGTRIAGVEQRLRDLASVRDAADARLSAVEDMLVGMDFADVRRSGAGRSSALCKFFQQGRCTKGADCRFVHEFEDGSATDDEDIPFDEQARHQDTNQARELWSDENDDPPGANLAVD